MLPANLWLFFFEASGEPTPPPLAGVLITTVIQIPQPELALVGGIVLGG